MNYFFIILTKTYFIYLKTFITFAFYWFKFDEFDIKKF